MSYFVSHLDQYFDTKIKDRSDKGRIVFNSKNKPKHAFSGLNIYKRGNVVSGQKTQGGRMKSNSLLNMRHSP